MSEVASRLGGSKATLYSYFDSKEALFVTVMLEKAKALIGPLTEAFSHSTDIGQAVQRFAVEYLNIILEPEVLAMKRMTMAQAERCGFGKRIYEEAIKPAWADIAARLQKAMDAGQLRQSDPFVAVMHLKGLCEAGLIDQCLNGCRDTPTKAEVVETARLGADAFLRAYKPD
jgi:AcrR family transcriptional regulator